MKHDMEVEKRLAAAFEEVGNAVIHMLAAAQTTDWEQRHRASEELGKAAAGVYRALCNESTG